MLDLRKRAHQTTTLRDRMDILFGYRHIESVQCNADHRAQTEELDQFGDANSVNVHGNTVAEPARQNTSCIHGVARVVDGDYVHG